MSRETIMAALLGQLTASGTFLTSGRRLVLWTQVQAQPALFLRHVGDEYPARATRLPAKVTMQCEAWVYCKGNLALSNPADVAMNALLDQIEASLAPAPGLEAQTLGGLVTHCWIEGKIEVHPGDLDNQAIAIVPIKILVPTLQGS